MTTDSSHSLPIAVIGGGVTGLATAYALSRQGHRVRLFEASDRIGGAVQTELTPDGWLIEAGPNTLLLGDPKVRTLFDELGLASELCTARPEAKNRYLVRNGKLWPLPTSPGSFISTGLFSARAKFGIVTELLKRPRSRASDVSLSALVESHFGREIVDYALQPFVSGVFAGNPAKLSAKLAFPQLWDAELQHGSLIRGQIASAKARKARGEPRASIISFRKGLATIPSTLAGRLPSGTIECGAKVETLISDGAWKLVWSRNGLTTTESFAAVALALPAHALARLTVGPLGERPLAALDSIEYPPVASLFLGYRRDQVAHPLDGFGLLIPAVEKRQLLGILFSSSLFAGRAPEGHVGLTLMLGGASAPDRAHLDTPAALEMAKRELASLLGVTGEPTLVRHHRWTRAIPQYNIGYERFIDAMVRTETHHPGLLVGGHVRDGISLTQCLASGLRLAERASALARTSSRG
ncbi:MAG: protoporphyrinogen oxidase [Opitutaceae bacterium]